MEHPDSGTRRTRSKPRPSWRQRMYAWSLLAGIMASVIVVLAISIPWAAMKLGIRPAFSWSLFRIGHAELNCQYNLLKGHSYHRRVLYNGPVFALANDSMVLAYQLTPSPDSPGSLAVSVSPLFSQQHAWYREFERRSSGEIILRLHANHFYWVTVAYRHYLGTAKVNWFITHITTPSRGDSHGT